ncbi:19789_t:CDS:2 [Racocetra persica]|uniref:19789_t:CDS:1 n=1 Tax=Racocetra persica TaxID=160502 RepID=A0ACA9L3S6_9GLOM|nr:19789_t:CDS:2 [Racocetra persica]
MFMIVVKQMMFVTNDNEDIRVCDNGSCEEDIGVCNNGSCKDKIEEYDFLDILE